jgi:hypothetical protein
VVANILKTDSDMSMEESVESGDFEVEKNHHNFALSESAKKSQFFFAIDKSRLSDPDPHYIRLRDSESN